MPSVNYQGGSGSQNNGDGGGTDKIWAFNGSNPADFAEWKEWAWAMLHALPTNVMMSNNGGNTGG